MEREIAHGTHFHKTVTDCPGHTLTSIGGRYHASEMVNGRVVHTPIDHVPDRQVSGGRTYLYEVLQVTCPGHGDLPIRIRWVGASALSPTIDPVSHRKGSKAAAEALLRAKEEEVEIMRARRRLTWTRPFGCEPPTDVYRGWRNTIETFHSMLDTSMTNGRMPAYSLRMKQIKMMGFALGQNLAAASRLACPDPVQAALAAGIRNTAGPPGQVAA